jgi:hypothetical protein
MDKNERRFFKKEINSQFEFVENPAAWKTLRPGLAGQPWPGAGRCAQRAGGTCG